MQTILQDPGENTAVHCVQQGVLMGVWMNLDLVGKLTDRPLLQSVVELIRQKNNFYRWTLASRAWWPFGKENLWSKWRFPPWEDEGNNLGQTVRLIKDIFECWFPSYKTSGQTLMFPADHRAWCWPSCVQGDSCGTECCQIAGHPSGARISHSASWIDTTSHCTFPWQYSP